MKWLPILRIGVGLLLLLSTVLGAFTVRTISKTRSWLDESSKAMVGYALAERTLQVDLVNARAGLLRNYDPINADIAVARRNLARLEGLSTSGRARKILAVLTKKHDEQERVVEQFKSDNALLQNSLAHFTAKGSAKVRAYHILSAPILRLMLDTSAPTVQAAQEVLHRIPPASDGTASAQFTAHAHLLIDVLPRIDRLLYSIRAMEMERDIGELQIALNEESDSHNILVRRLEMMLAITTISLILAIVALAIAQYFRTRDLKAQAANERLSAAIATPLIDTGHGTFASRVEEAVHHLAFHIGARRLQLIIPGVLNGRRFSWPDAGPHPDWLRSLADAANTDGAWDGGRVIASRSRCPAGNALCQAMTEADVEKVIMLRTTDPCDVIIGFEPNDSAATQRRDHLAGLASAIVAIAHAARRSIMLLERERLQRSLSRAHRMETIGAMASGVAHNFNNIIGAIGGFAEMGQARTHKMSRARYSFDEIQGAVERARDLVNDILHFSKQGQSAKAPLNLVEVLTQTLRLLSASARSDAAFRLSVSDTHYPICGARAELQQVFLNICNNAAHASGGHQVKILARRVHLMEKRHVSHGCLDPSDYVVVTVSDKGAGITDTARRRLFEPFFTTKAGGTGLGLSTAWEIIQDHGGTIHVENARNGGARFSVWLPETPFGVDVQLAGDGKRILLLTETDQRDAEEEMLADLGYEPISLPIETAIEERIDLMKEIDAVVIATWRSWRVEDLIKRLAPFLDGQPVLLAVPNANMLQSPLRCSSLTYPPRACDLAVQLAQLRHNRSQ